MKIDSKAFLTDLFFHRFTGIVLEYDEFLVIKTPTNPTFFWGNLLYFKNPPTPYSYLLWKELFNDQFKTMGVEHMTFAWDSITGDVGSPELFLNDGFNLETSIVMVADTIVKPKKINHELQIKLIDNESDWEKVIENHVLCRAEHFQEIPYRKYAAKKIADYRLMIKDQKGFWVGAFLGERLVGDLGIFAQNGLGRFQTVGTHPDYRRQGICSTLVYQTCLFAMEQMQVKEFIMVADPFYHAAKIYESVGFLPKEMQIGLCKFNEELWAT